MNRRLKKFVRRFIRAKQRFAKALQDGMLQIRYSQVWKQLCVTGDMQYRERICGLNYMILPSIGLK